MRAYDALAGAYDALTYDIPYETILTFWETVLGSLGKQPRAVLDMACGTGSLSVLLAEKGYSVLASDISEEMLTEAVDKAAELENPPFFICQSMQELSLPRPVDWIVSCLDGINYLTDPEDCRETFRRCHESLCDGGVLCFDINSAYKLRSLDGGIWLDETEDTYCVWRTEFEETENICYYGMDLFTRLDDDTWQRDVEEHCQYAYTVEELKRYLAEAGFQEIRIFGDMTMNDPKENTQRIYFCAVKE